MIILHFIRHFESSTAACLALWKYVINSSADMSISSFISLNIKDNDTYQKKRRGEGGRGEGAGRERGGSGEGAGREREGRGKGEGREREGIGEAEGRERGGRGENMQDTLFQRSRVFVLIRYVGFSGFSFLFTFCG